MALVLVGDPTKSGPYVIRVKLPHDVTMMPHRHSEDRVYVVISRVFYIGLGISSMSANSPPTHQESS